MLGSSVPVGREWDRPRGCPLSRRVPQFRGNSGSGLRPPPGRGSWALRLCGARHTSGGGRSRSAGRGLGAPLAASAALPHRGPRPGPAPCTRLRADPSTSPPRAAAVGLRDPRREQERGAGRGDSGRKGSRVGCPDLRTRCRRPRVARENQPQRSHGLLTLSNLRGEALKGRSLPTLPQNTKPSGKGSIC